MTMDFDDTAFDDDMPETPATATAEVPTGVRKPRIALMGEFSAGKSTLSNLLIGASPLPTKVTATQLPPVWISWGDDTPYREDLDGERHLIDMADLGSLSHEDTRLIRIFQKSDILNLCDIIDMPGISDPNMGSEVWERVIGEADGVIWCTHATQAWRQSEAAVWETMDQGLFAKSLLLVTRFDKVVTEDDRRRVMKRIERETRDLFLDRLPISLTQAIAARDDRDAWEASGAEAFTQRFVDLIDRLAADLRGGEADPIERRLGQHDDAAPSLSIAGTRIERPVAPRPVTPSRILPTRVRPTSYSRRPSARPEREERDFGGH